MAREKISAKMTAAISAAYQQWRQRSVTSAAAWRHLVNVCGSGGESGVA